MALLIPADGEPREVAPANGPTFTLAELQGFVGGYIEAVYLADGRVMFVNEDGKREQLPINHRATIEAVADGARLRPGDVIVGNAIVCTRAEADGDPISEDENA